MSNLVLRAIRRVAGRLKYWITMESAEVVLPNASFRLGNKERVILKMTKNVSGRRVHLWVKY